MTKEEAQKEIELLVRKVDEARKVMPPGKDLDDTICAIEADIRKLQKITGVVPITGISKI